MEQKEDGLTLGEIFHVMFIKKWLLLAITVIVMLLGVIFVHVLYNPSQEVYKIAFELEFPGVEDGRYPNQRKVVYNDFIKLESLEYVLKYNEGFEDVNVTKMAENNDISIEEYVYFTNNEEVKTGKYTITVLQKYFSSSEQAKDFLTCLTAIPIEYAMEMGKMIRYDADLEQASVSGDYETQINYLISQKELILAGYNDLIDTYSNNLEIAGVTLLQAKKEFIQFFDNNFIDTLLIEVKNKGYVKPGSDYVNSIIRKKTELLLEKEKNENEINALEKTINDIKTALGEGTQFIESVKSITDKIATLSSRNSEIDTKISQEYDKYINSVTAVTPEELAEFDAIIEFYTNNLEEFTLQYKNFQDNIYENYSYVIYANASRIVSDGGINLLLVVIAFLVIGFVVGCCINLIVDMPKYLKNKKNGTLTVEEPSTDKEEIEE